jgi:hypothetical protein
MPGVAPIALAVAFVAFALPAHAQQNIDFSKVEIIKTIDLGHNTYRLEGQGGNITVPSAAMASSWWTGNLLRSTTRLRPQSARSRRYRSSI